MRVFAAQAPCPRILQGFHRGRLAGTWACQPAMTTRQGNRPMHALAIASAPDADRRPRRGTGRRAESMRRLPSMLQLPLTYLTGKPHTGQRGPKLTPTFHLATALGSLGIGLSCTAAAWSGPNPLLLVLGWAITLHGMRQPAHADLPPSRPPQHVGQAARGPPRRAHHRRRPCRAELSALQQRAHQRPPRRAAHDAARPHRAGDAGHACGCAPA